MNMVFPAKLGMETTCSSGVHILLPSRLDEMQPILAEEELAVDEHRVRAENTAAKRLVGVPSQLLFDLDLLDDGEDLPRIEPALSENVRDHVRVAEVPRLAPHRVIDDVGIALKLPVLLGGGRAPHQLQRIDWKEQVVRKRHTVFSCVPHQVNQSFAL